MSVYFILNTKKQPYTLDINFKCSKLRLEELHTSFLPTFYIENAKKYFYFIDGELNFLPLTIPRKNDSIDKVFNWHFQTYSNDKFKAILNWISAEIKSGNEVSLIRQVEANDKHECYEYNIVYSKKYISLKDISKSDSISFEFNVEYEFKKD